MVPFVLTPREHHGATSVEDYLAQHRAFLAKKAGGRLIVHHSAVPLVAWVGANQWLVECECGAGNSTDPAWGLACCYGCGAIHREIQFPPDHAGIERALLERVRPADRHWLPGETADTLRAETRTGRP